MQYIGSQDGDTLYITSVEDSAVVHLGAGAQKAASGDALFAAFPTATSYQIDDGEISPVPEVA